MNKTMKKITAALLALCCVTVTGITAAAGDEGLSFGWGEVTWNAVKGLEEVPLPECFTSNPNCYHGQHYYIQPTGFTLEELTPRKNAIRFVMRDAETEEAMNALVEEVTEIVNSYLPEVQYHEYCWYSPQMDSVYLTQISTRFMGRRDAFELYVPDGLENRAEIESGILLALARKHLISEFYGWGETADYVTLFGDDRELIYFGNEEEGDWDSIAAYLAEHYPEITVEYTEYENGTKHYHLLDTGESSMQERAKMLLELEGLYGIVYMYAVNATEGESTVGHNALERKGDVTLDCELGITDVIALNRNLMTNDPLCDTAKKNADINGDGTPDEADALAILKEIVEITKNFKEP